MCLLLCQRLNTPQIIWIERPCISKNVDHRSGQPLSKAWWWSRFSHLVLFLGGSEGWRDTRITSRAHQLVSTSPPPPPSPPPRSPQGECVCAGRVCMGAGEHESSIMLLLGAARLLPVCCQRKQREVFMFVSPNYRVQ